MTWDAVKLYEDLEVATNRQCLGSSRKNWSVFLLPLWPYMKSVYPMHNIHIEAQGYYAIKGGLLCLSPWLPSKTCKGFWEGDRGKQIVSQWFSNRSNSAPIWPLTIYHQHFAISADMFGCHHGGEEVLLHLVGRDQECCEMFSNAQDSLSWQIIWPKMSIVSTYPPQISRLCSNNYLEYLCGSFRQ